MFFKPPYLWHMLWYGGLTVACNYGGAGGNAAPCPQRYSALQRKNGRMAALFVCKFSDFRGFFVV